MCEIGRKVLFKPDMDERGSEVYAEGVKKVMCSRRESVVMAQVRTGHCSRTNYWRHRMGLQEEGRCEGCAVQEEKDHWWECDRWCGLRHRVGWHGLGTLRDEAVVLRFLREAYPQWLA